MLGLMGSFTVYPHLVTDSGLRIRHGSGTVFLVPWQAVATVQVAERGREKSRALQLDRDGDAATLHVVVASRTSVNVTLHQSLVVQRPTREDEVTKLRFFADDAHSLLNQVRERLTPAA